MTSLGQPIVFGLLAILVHVLGIASALDAIMKARTSQGAIAWAVILITLPYLALPLYWFFGQRRFHGYVRARKLGDREVHYLADNLTGYVPNLDGALPSDRIALQAVETLAECPFTGQNAAVQWPWAALIKINVVPPEWGSGAAAGRIRRAPRVCSRDTNHRPSLGEVLWDARGWMACDSFGGIVTSYGASILAGTGFAPTQVTFLDLPLLHPNLGLRHIYTPLRRDVVTYVDSYFGTVLAAGGLTEVGGLIPGAAPTETIGNDLLECRCGERRFDGAGVRIETASPSKARYGYTEAHRRHEPEQRYPSCLTDAEWALVEDLFDNEGGRGLPPRYSRRLLVNACCYVVRTGCSWRMLPKEFPRWQDSSGVWDAKSNIRRRKHESHVSGQDVSEGQFCASGKHRALILMRTGREITFDNTPDRACYRA